MDHLRGKLLDTQGHTRFEHLDVSLEPLVTPEGGATWSGCFEPPTASALVSGETFRLVLDDGRAQDIEVKGVTVGSHGRPRVRF